MRFVFIAAEKAQYPVRLLCEVLGVKASDYYAWVDRPASPKKIADARLVVEIKAWPWCEATVAYGSPRGSAPSCVLHRHAWARSASSA